jgi:sensor histidine kinase YesM
MLLWPFISYYWKPHVTYQPRFDQWLLLLVINTPAAKQLVLLVLVLVLLVLVLLAFTLLMVVCCAAAAASQAPHLPNITESFIANILPEGEATSQQLVGQHAHAPQVGLFVITLHDKLRSHVGRGACSTTGTGSSHHPQH